MEFSLAVSPRSALATSSGSSSSCLLSFRCPARLIFVRVFFFLPFNRRYMCMVHVFSVKFEVAQVRRRCLHIVTKSTENSEGNPIECVVGCENTSNSNPLCRLSRRIFAWIACSPGKRERPCSCTLSDPLGRALESLHLTTVVSFLMPIS